MWESQPDTEPDMTTTKTGNPHETTMETIFVSISGSGTVENLENRGFEVVARSGYQVGSFQLEQDLTADDVMICGNLDVDERFLDKLRDDGHIKLQWGDYTVEAEWAS